MTLGVRVRVRGGATAALLLAGGVGAQQPAAPPRDSLTPARLEQEARRIIAAVPFPALVTVGLDGAPQARPVQPLRAADGGGTGRGESGGGGGRGRLRLHAGPTPPGPHAL